MWQGHASSAMRDNFRLLVIVGKAALIAAGGNFAVVLTLSRIGFNPDHKSTWLGIFVLVACLLPLGLAMVWTHRKLRTVYQPRGARAASIAFSLFTPISLLVSIVVPIPGAYALDIGGPKFLALIGFVLGTVVTTALLSFVVCVLVLRVTRLAIEVEQVE
jgi:drug/metabolite transporter (DMT)-like permease